MWFVPPDPLDSEKFYDVRIKSIPYSKNEGMLELRSKKTAGELSACITYVIVFHVYLLTTEFLLISRSTVH